MMMIHADGFKVTAERLLSHDDGRQFSAQDVIAYAGGKPIATVTVFDACLPEAVIGEQGDGRCAVFASIHANAGKKMSMERSIASDGGTVYSFGYEPTHGGFERVLWVFIPKEKDAGYRHEEAAVATA